MPFQLIIADVSFLDTQAISQQLLEFWSFEGGAVVLVVSVEDGLEAVVGDVDNIEFGSH